jgi:putative ubiquitin-RnfH superfamily antitoxin RatB of RatAB toxin-antitoxin module
MAEPHLRISVVYAPTARTLHEVQLSLAAGVTVWAAVQASGVLAHFPALDLAQAGVGVWGQSARPEQVLRDLDRVEIYRPLLVDPKVARRERFQKQGVRSTGLFARKRPGAKAGY